MMRAVPGSPLPFERCDNFRELGGYAGLGGKHVKYGAFYRAPALANLRTEADWALFCSLGVKTVFDFRSDAERAQLPDPELPGVRCVHAPAMLDGGGGGVNFDLNAILAGGERAIDGMLDWVESSYAGIAFGNPAYRQLFEAIAAGKTPVLFHCSAGKDRTGVAAALILLALGVAREDVVRDYLLTNDCRARSRTALVKKLEPALGARAAEYADVIGGVRQSSIDTTLDAIERRYPSFEAYLEAECGVTPAALARIREQYLE